ncbi:MULTISPECIES: hypothetical protein [unclassified Oleiphilus]|uniref:hypothetical protein n=1 Tax=unclassified Oleiphilus TaxID=2631174 RepID=UPI0007C23C58|nr:MULTISPECIES: hypothetical protein [unclassified Oleiphilus]KZY42912.1 hypothetical protein A3732_15455 [Oleiphilus sp. HI0050]KZZ34837.1 hypothetical protein A3757_16990 [Oleiphilus sp. HI0117]KZZ61421.1 hypothetical protein A3761_04300 [Oleiphilus sp. HI0123]
MIERIGFILLLSFSTASVASTLAGAVVDKLMVDTVNGGIMFVSATGTYTASGCTTNSTWEYVLPLNSELRKSTMVSMLLAAYASGKTVLLKGNGVCGDTFSSIETLQRVSLE